MSDNKPAKKKFGAVGRPSNRNGPTKNLLSVRAELTRRNFNPVKEYIDLMEQMDDPVERLKALQFLMQYTYPKLKETEIKPEDEDDGVIDVTPKEMSDEELLAEVDKAGSSEN